MTIPTQTDVVIVGAGPCGLSAACFLQKSGIQTVVIDASPEPAITSRAAVVHLRTLEIFEALNLTQPIIDNGIPIRAMTVCEKDQVISSLNFPRLKHKYEAAVSIPQTETERLITKTLHELGGNIHRGVSMTELLRNDESGVELAVKDVKTGETTRITSKYLIGADGFHSTVRQAVGIPFEGEQYELDFVTADVLLDTSVWPHQNHRDSGMTFLSPAGVLLVIPWPSEEANLYRIIATVETSPKHPDVQLLDHIMHSRGPTMPKKAVVTEVVWSSHFRIHHRLAAQYRKTRVFIAGDAAHVHSPAGGQGMNTGIQDAQYLAGVMADALLKGQTQAQDLNKYETVRRPVAQGVIAMTHRLTTAATFKHPLLCLWRNWAMWALNTLIPGMQTYMALRMSELET